MVADILVARQSPMPFCTPTTWMRIALAAIPITTVAESMADHDIQGAQLPKSQRVGAGDAEQFVGFQGVVGLSAEGGE